MEITWVGGSCFRIRGREGSIVTDPHTSKETKKSAFPKADLVVVTDHTMAENAENCVRPNHRESPPFVAFGPGEYDVRGLYLHGVSNQDASTDASTIFAMDIDRMTLAFFSRPSLTFENELLDELGTIQILIVNADTGIEQLTPLISRIEPNIVLPFGNSTTQTWMEVAQQLTEDHLTSEASLNVTASTLPEPITTCVLTERAA
tara:strand:+ start:5557 stop:6168 length:612 start_codon:yes stop_codon:yes gene_type:complete